MITQLPWPLQRVGDQTNYVIKIEPSDSWGKEIQEMLALGYRPLSAQEVLQKQVQLVKVGDFYREDLIRIDQSLQHRLKDAGYNVGNAQDQAAMSIIECIDSCVHASGLTNEERRAKITELTQDYAIISQASSCAREIADELAIRAISVIDCRQYPKGDLNFYQIPAKVTTLELPGQSLLYQVYRELMAGDAEKPRERGVAPQNRHKLIKDEGILAYVGYASGIFRDGRDHLFGHATALPAEDFEKFLHQLQSVVFTSYSSPSTLNPEHHSVLGRDIFEYIRILDEWAYKVKGKEDDEAVRSWVGQQILAPLEVKRKERERNTHRPKIIVTNDSMFPQSYFVEKLVDERIARCEQRQKIVADFRLIQQKYGNSQVVLGCDELSPYSSNFDKKVVGTIYRELSKLQKIEQLTTTFREEANDLTKRVEQSSARVISEDKKDEWQLYAAGSPIIVSDLVAYGFTQESDFVIKIIPDGINRYPELVEKDPTTMILNAEKYQALEGKEIVIPSHEFNMNYQQERNAITLKSEVGLKIRLDPVWGTLVNNYTDLFSLTELQQDKARNRHPDFIARMSRGSPGLIPLETTLLLSENGENFGSRCPRDHFRVSPIVVNPQCGDQLYSTRSRDESGQGTNLPPLLIAGKYQRGFTLVGVEKAKT